MASIATRTWKKQGGGVTTKHTVTYFDDGGKRRRRDFDTRRGAGKFVETLSERRATGELLAQDNEVRTFADVAESYLTACRDGRDGAPPIEPRTLAEYRIRITQQVLPKVPNVLIAKFTRDDMRKLRDKIAAAPIAVSSRRKDLFLAKAVAKHAVYMGWLRFDPTVDVKIRRDNRREAAVANAVKIHTREEMGAILAAAHRLRSRTGKEAFQGKTWVRFEAMLHTMVYCGLRMSELRGLPADAIDLEARTLRVYQRAAMDGTIGPPKSQHAYRTIHMPEGLTAILASWLGERVEGLAFPTESGAPIQHSNLANRMWRRAQVEANVTILNPHAARHFFASMLIHGGVRLKPLQEALGHHDPMFTMRVYGHLFTDPEDVALRQEMAQQMERTLTRVDDED